MAEACDVYWWLKAALLGCVLVVSIPSASAQGGSGLVRVWVDATVDQIEIPVDATEVVVPLHIHAIVSNTTCLETKFQVTLGFLTPPETPLWANDTVYDPPVANFSLDGDYRYLNPNAAVEADGDYVLRIRWHPGLTPEEAAWVYKLFAVQPTHFINDDVHQLVYDLTPIAIGGPCYANPVLKQEGPFRLRTFREGAEPPPAIATIGPTGEVGVVTTDDAGRVSHVDATSNAIDGGVASKAAGGDSPNPAVPLVLLGIVGAILAGRRRS